MKAQIFITEIKRLAGDSVISDSFNQANQLVPMSIWLQIIHHIDN